MLGKIASMEINHKAVEKAKKGDDIALKIEATNADESAKLYGRHFDFKVCNAPFSCITCTTCHCVMPRALSLNSSVEGGRHLQDFPEAWQENLAFPPIPRCLPSRQPFVTCKRIQSNLMSIIKGNLVLIRDTNWRELCVVANDNEKASTL